MELDERSIDSPSRGGRRRRSLGEPEPASYRRRRSVKAPGDYRGSTAKP